MSITSMAYIVFSIHVTKYNRVSYLINNTSSSNDNSRCSFLPQQFLFRKVSGRLHIELWRIAGNLVNTSSTNNSMTSSTYSNTSCVNNPTMTSSMNASITSESDSDLNKSTDDGQPESIVCQVSNGHYF